MLRMLCACVAYPLAERLQGRQIRSKLSALRAQMALPFPQRSELRRKQLADMLERAGSDVPYYKELFARLKFRPQLVSRDLGFLNELPFLTKDIIREQGTRLLSTAF